MEVTKEWLEEYYVRRKLSQTECGELSGLTRSTIQRKLKKYGIKTRQSQTQRSINEAFEVEGIKVKTCSKCGRLLLACFFHKDKRAKDGLTCNCMDCRHEAKIKYYRSKEGIEHSRQGYKRYKIKHAGEIKPSKIKKQENIKWAKDNGYIQPNVPEDKREYQVNDHFFDVLDTDEKCYILGFIAADGHVCNSHITITLKRSDSEILFKIAAILGLTKSVAFTKSKANGKTYPQCCLSFSSKQMGQKLTEYGLAGNKTYSLEYPKQIPEQFHNSFIRGFFDGDGSIYGSKDTLCPQVEIVGASPDIFTTLQQIFINYLGFKPTITKREIKDKHPVYRFRFGGKYKCYKFTKWIYKDASLYLPRKKKRFSMVRKHKQFIIEQEQGQLIIA